MTDNRAISPLELSRYDFYVVVEGMTCRSCEVMIERKIKKIHGVESVAADSHRGLVHIIYVSATPPHTETFREALAVDPKYDVKGMLNYHKAAQYKAQRLDAVSRPSPARIAGMFALAFIVGILFLKLGLVKSNIAISSSIQVGAAFVIGLIAAVSSCIAVIGGLLISSVAQYQKARGGDESFRSRMIPVGLFIVGRVLSYTVFGGIIALLGAAFSPSPLFTGGVVFLAATYMIVMGLEMLQILPYGLKRVLPGLPKSLSHKMMDIGMGKNIQGLTPFLTGMGTFFVPCGFTQALQLYALTAGSFMSGALVLGAFALGTVPALSLLGLSMNAFKGSARTFFFHFAGALIILMGLGNVQNSLALMGYPVSLASIGNAIKSAASESTSATNQNTSVPSVIDGQAQVIRMVASGGYSPEELSVKAGLPVKWVIDATNAYGCERAFNVPKLGIRKVLEQKVNTIEFTAPQSGDYVYTCSMGMYRGILHVN